MRLLLDTHTFIFWDSQPSKLSPRALELLRNKDNLRLLSVVSLWEIQIKHQLGKLTLNKTLAEIGSPAYAMLMYNAIQKWSDGTTAYRTTEYSGFSSRVLSKFRTRIDTRCGSRN